MTATGLVRCEQITCLCCQRQLPANAGLLMDLGFPSVCPECGGHAWRKEGAVVCTIILGVPRGDYAWRPDLTKVDDR